MLTFIKKPAIFDDYSVIGFDLDLVLGQAGTLSIHFHPRASTRQADFKVFEALQGTLGEETDCKYDDWAFAGNVEEVECDTTRRDVRIALKDGLSKLGRVCRSQVFVNQRLGEIVSSLMPPGQKCQCSPEFEGHDVKFAIQYQESDLVFLKRLVNYHGGQIWCPGNAICVGTPQGGGSLTLRLHSDIQECILHTNLGPERVRVKAIPYTGEASRESKIELSGKNQGAIQKAVKERREKYQGNSLLHIILEDSSQSDPEFMAKRFLKSRAAGRLSVTGVVNRLVHPGTAVAVVDSGGNAESLVVRSLSGTWRYDMGGRFYFEAATAEGLIFDAPVIERELLASPAVVDQSNDSLNRVRVYFPWDPNESVTPWLRIVSPYWGDQHMLYAPPKRGDSVLVVWGQEDLDPIVLGSLSAGQAIKEKSEPFVLKTADGQTVTFSKKSIKIVNEADGGKTSVELLPDKVVISSDKIELKSDKVEVKSSVVGIKTTKLDVQ